MTHQVHTRSGISLQVKLLFGLLLIAVVPMVILSAALASGMYLQAAMIGAVVTQIVGAIIGYSVVSGIVRQASTIKTTLMNINNGDFEARAMASSGDELGEVAVALNTMCDNSLNLIQSNEERDQVQSSIENLIAEMKEIAAGDLTIRTTEVREDMTGAIAESVNQMTQQLCSIVQQVQSAAGQVTTLSTRIQESSTTLSSESDAQASRIGEASRVLSEMTGSFQDVAAVTEESVQVAIEARETASNGLKAVSDTVDGMQRIRNQVQSTSKRIKRFGESSQEIGEIVQLISDITDRTSILALNASIQAAMAGEAGQGFAVVAEEIERLADSSKDATKQISKLVRAIQNETSEVISDMEEATREVVAGSQLANQAGEMLFEIDSVSSQLVELIQTSSSSVLQQADSTSQIASAMTDIVHSTKASAEKNREATRSVGRLASLVSQLRDSVSRFRIPGGIECLEFEKTPEPDVANNVSEVKAPVERTNPYMGVNAIPGKRTTCNTERRDAGDGKATTIGISKSITEQATECCDAMENQLLHQLREATVLLDNQNKTEQTDENDSPANGTGARAEGENRNARRDSNPTIMIDDV